MAHTVSPKPCASSIAAAQTDCLAPSVAQPDHVATIQLQLDAWQVAQPGQRGMGAAEVVDRDADIIELQLGGDFPHAARVVQHFTLADLDDQARENPPSSAARFG